MSSLRVWSTDRYFYEDDIKELEKAYKELKELDVEVYFVDRRDKYKAGAMLIGVIYAVGDSPDELFEVLATKCIKFHHYDSLNAVDNNMPSFCGHCGKFNE